MTTDAGSQQPVEVKPVDLTRSAAADFAEAFGGGAGAVQRAVDGKPADGTTTTSQPTGAQGDDADDPYKDIDVETLLKSKALGPKLNQWADKAHIAQVRAAEARALQQGETVGIAKGKEQLSQEQEDRFFSSLSKEELGQELAADPELAPKYAQHLERTRGKGGGTGASEEEQALATQTIALATQIDATLILLKDSGLPDDVREQLKPENYVDQGAPGVAKWTADVMAAKAKHDGEQAVRGVTNDETEAAIQRRNAADDAVRPGALPPGQRTGPLPDLMKTPLKQQFDMAFGAPRRA